MQTTKSPSGLRGTALWQLTVARFRMFFREPSAVFWTFGFPILLALALGIAFRNRPPEPVYAAVTRGAGADALVAALQKGPDVKVELMDEPGAARALRIGRVSVVVVPGAPRTYRYDPTRPQSRLARVVVDDVLQRAAGRADAAPVAEQRVTEPGSRYIDFLIPGLLGMNLMSAGMWGIGYLIVEMRTRKLIKRMIATPMRKTDFLLSFVLMRVMFLVFEVPVVLGFARLVFGVRITGPIALFATLCVLGALAFAGIGLLVASRAQNTQTVGGLINLVMMPMFIGSGVFFSTAHFPDAMQPFIRALPLTTLNDALRAVMNEGAGWSQLAVPVAALAAWSAITFGAALKLFRWQ